MQVVDIQAFSAIGSAEELPPRIRADSARFRADPPDVRQKYFSADSAERSADSARIRADPRGLRGELAEEFTR